MNLIIICIDTLRYDHLGCNGNEWINTPNLDAFASEAVVYDNAYVGSFPTIPHRTDVLTGRFGQPLHPWLPLGFDALTLPRVLGDQGWATYLVFDTPHLINGGHGFDYPFHGWHFERGNEVDRHIIDDRGVDVNGPYSSRYSNRLRTLTYPQYVRNNRGRSLESEWPSPRVFAAASDFIEANRKRDHTFIWIDCFDPHEPWDPPAHYVALYDDETLCRDAQMMGWEPLESLTPRELAHVKAHYAGEVTMVDRHLGGFLNKLAVTGRAADTAVVITADHGTNLGSHGRLGKSSPLYEQVSHVPLMMRLPGVEPGRRDQIVQPADLMPTLLELFEMEVPDACQGRSFARTIFDVDALARDVAVSGKAIDLSLDEQAHLTVQDARWCLIDTPDPEARELYDKQADREESDNVIDRYPAVVHRLHRAALDFLREHEAHPSLVSWFETGQKGDLTDYQHRPAYLANYHPYFEDGLEEQLPR